MGLGGSAGAQAIGQALDDYEISHELFFSATPPGAEGGIAFSSARYFYASCGNVGISPIAAAPSPIGRWVKGSGEFIFVPDFQSPAMVSIVPWDMDPVSGFTQAKMLEFRELYGDILLPPQFNPLGQFVSLNQFAGVAETQFTAGLYGSELPQTVISSLDDVPRPSDFPDEEIAALDGRTTVVEFTVPASPFQEYGLKSVVSQFMKQIIANQLMADGYPPQVAELAAGAHMLQQSPYLVKVVGFDPNYGLPIVAPADPVNAYKLRGWFVEGNGITDDAGTLHRPLVLFSHGWSQSMTGARDQCRNYRRMIYHLAMLGYSVLFYDQEAHGISEGWNRGHNFSPPSAGVQLHAPGLNPSAPLEWLPVPDAIIPNPIETGNSVNVFHIIDQLAANGLIDGAYSTPIILYGISQGALISVKAMQLRFATPAGLQKPGGYSGYNIRGIIDSDCVGASLKFMADGLDAPMGFHMVAEATLRSFFDTQMFSDGDIHGSIQYWPGYLGLKAVYDYMAPDGVVSAYNRARGFKDIAMVLGWHDWGLLFEPNFSYTIKRIARFCRQVTLNSPPTGNSATTSLRNEMCKAPVFDLGTLGTPPFQGKLFGAHNSLERLIENVKKEHPI